VRLSHGGTAGYGEACLPAYLGETQEAITEFFEKARAILEDLSLPVDPEAVLSLVDQLGEGCNAAKAAIDIALHDLVSRAQGIPLYGLLGLQKPSPAATSFTIAIDSADRLERKLVEADDYKILKIKAGTADDKKLIRQIRKHTYKPLFVDVNQGWRDKHMVLDMIGWMKEQGVLLVEQPMPVHMREEMAWVREKSPLPVIADESVKRLKDLEAIKGVFSGVNVKLMKSTGLREALAIINRARSLGLKVMLGCMAESSCATGAMAHLTTLGDFIDLDAPRLYRNDPFSGLSYRNGRIVISDGPGSGVCPSGQLIEEKQWQMS
jgi:L-alanine-DL-glutamate epimerase-like enolase superfamily enzyme